MQVKTRQILQVLCMSVTVYLNLEDLFVAIIGILNQNLFTHIIFKAFVLFKWSYTEREKFISTVMLCSSWCCL